MQTTIPHPLRQNRAEASAFELVRAVSDSGGRDKAGSLEEVVDFVLRFEGDWLAE